jgi:hypothetical protein
MPRTRLLLTCIAAALLTIPASALASTRSGSTTLAPGGTTPGTVTAKCPSHQRATGGGFQAPPMDFVALTTFVEVFESRKIGQRSWRVSGLEGGTSPASLSAIVYCSMAGPKTKEKSATVAVPPPPPLGLTPANVSCGKSGKAQAGGFISPPGPSSSNTVIVTDSFRTGRKSWQNRAIYSNGSPTLTSYVYCADQKAPKARSASIASSTFGEPKTAISKECKSGTHIVAGGYRQPNATQGGSFGYYTFPWESRASGKRWQTSAIHLGTVSTALVAVAYCGG